MRWLFLAALLWCGPCPCASALPLPAFSDHWRLTDPPAQRYVLALARSAFDTYARTRTVIDPPPPLPAFLRQPRQPRHP